VTPIHDRIKPGENEKIAAWALRWGVSPLTVMAAIVKAGPLLRDVAVEVWKTV
jgi:hypothetical protein